MALSEQEQRLLEEMERSLYQSESDVMQTNSGTRRTISYRSLVLGIVVVVLGIGVLVGGVAMQQPWLGLIGFVAMLGGAVLMFRKEDVPPEPSKGASGRDGSSGGSAARESVNERMQRRWDQRMGGER